MELGAAVVGLGVGAAHARAWAEAGVPVRWLLDLDAEKAAATAAELGGDARVARTYDEILGDPAVSVVSIASYDDAHFEQAVDALNARKHVFVEKPLCRTVEEVRRVEQAWESAGRPLLRSNLVLRAAPLYVWLRDRLEAGDLGELYAFDGDYLYGRLHKITEGWRGGVEDYSVMLGGGIHLVDLMLWLTGQRPVAVSAVGNRIATEGTEFRYLDYVAATYRFDSGLVGRIGANFGCVHPHTHAVRAFGTRGTVLNDDAGPRRHRGRDDEPDVEQLDLAPVPASKGALIADFARSIREAGGSDGDTRHEFALIRACAAADRALTERREVEVDYS
jgi:predicted dehydrogenase